jgi:hypothetical protein
MGTSTLGDRIFQELLGRLINQTRLSSVKRVAVLSASEFKEEYAAKSQPVIFEGIIPAGLTDQQEALRILRLAMGFEIVKARYGAYADPAVYMGRRMTNALTLNTFLTMLDSGECNEQHLYVANAGISNRTAEMLGLKPPTYYPVADFRPPRLWLGPRAAITPLHKDGSDNFSLHIFGSKRWMLLPVRDFPLLYMTEQNPHSFPGFACSCVDVRTPNFELFPLYRFARPLSVEVKAGEILYLPAGWSHYVETLGPTLMVNYWVDNRHRLPAYLESAGLTKRVLSGRPRTK